MKELQNINYIYSPIVNKNIPVILEVIAICANRPERSGMNKMLSHNGLTTHGGGMLVITQNHTNFHHVNLA